MSIAIHRLCDGDRFAIAESIATANYREQEESKLFASLAFRSWLHDNRTTQGFKDAKSALSSSCQLLEEVVSAYPMSLKFHIGLCCHAVAVLEEMAWQVSFA